MTDVFIYLCSPPLIPNHCPPGASHWSCHRHVYSSAILLHILVGVIFWKHVRACLPLLPPQAPGQETKCLTGLTCSCTCLPAQPHLESLFPCLSLIQPEVQSAKSVLPQGLCTCCSLSSVGFLPDSAPTLLLGKFRLAFLLPKVISSRKPSVTYTSRLVDSSHPPHRASYIVDS